MNLFVDFDNCISNLSGTLLVSLAKLLYVRHDRIYARAITQQGGSRMATGGAMTGTSDNDTSVLSSGDVSVTRGETPMNPLR